MNVHADFKELNLPAAKEKGRIPIFFDFTLGNPPREFSFPCVFDDVVAKTSDKLDGMILLPKSVPVDKSLLGKEIWARSDWTSVFNPTILGRKEFVVPLMNPRYWDHGGITGIVSTLLLGNSAKYEADNIQYLASQRSHSFDLELPMVIDLHVLGNGEVQKEFVEIVELGLNLAVELGCDAIIIPNGNYLLTNKNINDIADIPVLIRHSLCNFGSDDQISETEGWGAYLEKMDGVVFTDTLHWMQFNDHHQLLQR